LAEKTKLTLRLISWTVQHYSTLKDIIGERLLEMQNRGVERIVFYGVSDEMEIAYVTLQGSSLKLVGIVEDQEKMNRKKIFGFELTEVNQVETLKPDAVLITSLIDMDGKEQNLRKFLDLGRVRIANISAC
jgi:hypothetical protein